mgnify:CR=1 FL=1
MRIALLGSNGQLGQDLQQALRPNDVICLTREDFDIVDHTAVRLSLESIRPNVILNTTAYHRVDDCEVEVELAYRVNALSVLQLSRLAVELDVALVHFSTDYVFDGTKAGPYHEWDTPDPRSVYGRSKLGGELACGPEATVVRTSWVCGRYGPNMVRTVLRAAAQPGRLRFVADQVGHPTFADDLAGMLLRLGIDRRPGTFHVTNQGAVSWFGFVQAILAAAGDDPDRVDPITTAELDPPRPAPRPANSVLDNAALRLSGIDLLDDFRVPLARLVAHLRDT